MPALNAVQPKSLKITDILYGFWATSPECLKFLIILCTVNKIEYSKFYSEIELCLKYPEEFFYSLSFYDWINLLGFNIFIWLFSCLVFLSFVWLLVKYWFKHHWIIFLIVFTAHSFSFGIDVIMVTFPLFVQQYLLFKKIEEFYFTTKKNKKLKNTILWLWMSLQCYWVPSYFLLF